jgi:hypothetical protein
MTDEIWKIIENYESYSVSTFGNVRNDKFDRIIKPGKHTQGYFRVSLSKNNIKKMFLVHRLVALAFIENSENKKCVDHIDNNPLNNNLINLRWATNTENSRNSKKPITNTSGVKGVHFHKQKNKWSAQIYIGGKQIHLGYFETIEEASLARQTKALEIFGEFVNDCEKI